MDTQKEEGAYLPHSERVRVKVLVRAIRRSYLIPQSLRKCLFLSCAFYTTLTIMAPKPRSSRTHWSKRSLRPGPHSSVRSSSTAVRPGDSERVPIALRSSHASSRATSHRGSERSESVAPIQAPVQPSIEDNSDVDDSVHDDSLNEIVMAVDVRSRGTVGCAYYVAREEKFYFMEDVKLGGADIVEARPDFPPLRLDHR